MLWRSPVDAFARHFCSPLVDLRSWEEFHGQWPAMIVMALNARLPECYVAAPHVRLGAQFEVDAPEQDEYEVRIYEDTRPARRLVAAAELVSPANKDRPEHRGAFVAKCVALLQRQVSVAIVDLVTTRAFNLYAELLEMLGQSDPAMTSTSPSIYAAACQQVRDGDVWRFRAWTHALNIRQPLPTLPLWLSERLAVPLDLDASYEDTCRVLRMPVDI